MAIDADPADELNGSAPAVNNHDRDGETIDQCERDNGPDTAEQSHVTGIRTALLAGITVVVVVAGVTGWLGVRGYQARHANEQRNHFVAAASQAALNLTTISYTDVDDALRRILDSSTGDFHDDFEGRSKPFADVVRQAKSESKGTITAAGLESRSGNQAQVLVAVTVNTTVNGAAESQPRLWRMRLSVVDVDGDVKVSDVKFVP